MHIFIPRETDPQETRIPLLGEDCGKMVQLGAEVEVEAGIGQSLNIPDTDYETRGAGIANDRQAALSAANQSMSRLLGYARATPNCCQEQE